MNARLSVVPILLLATGLATPLAAQVASAAPASEAVDAIKREGLENSRVMDYLDQLTNHIGGRLTGSDNFTLACEWARGEFEKMGLDARLEPWGEWNIVWNRGQWDARVLEPEPMELQVATPAWTPGTKGRQQGPLVKSPVTEAELDAGRGKLAGAWVYQVPLPTISRDLPADERRAARLAQRELRRKIDAALVEAGALGTLSSSQGDQRYPDRIRVFGDSNIARGDGSNIPKLPEIVVRHDQAQRLEAMLDQGQPVVLECDIRNRFRPGPIVLNNVIAEIPGTDKPDECVIVCGHLDSWHQATGTTDNGTGTVTTMEAARILAAAGVRPRRTIRFLLWGGEEQGLLGSNAYVTRHRSEMPKVSAVFNHDTGTNWANSLAVTEAMVEPLTAVFAPVMSLPAPDAEHEGPVFDLRTVQRIRGGGGSDHASFLRAGVPAWSWGLKGRADYSYSWHSQWDTYDVAIPEYQRHTATVIALAAYGVANLPELLPRDGVQGAQGSDAGLFIGALLGAELDEATFKTIEAEGVAAKAGIRAGDVLTKINGESAQRAQILGMLRDEDVEQILLTLKRGSEEITVTLVKDDLLQAMRARRGNRGGEGAGATRRGGRRRGGG